MRAALISEGVPCGRGYKRLWNEIIGQTFANMTEADIKAMLYDLLTCYDITPADRAEIMHLLRLSSTAFTTEQREAMTYRLQD